MAYKSSWYIFIALLLLATIATTFVPENFYNFLRFILFTALIVHTLNYCLENVTPSPSKNSAFANNTKRERPVASVVQHPEISLSPEQYLTDEKIVEIKKSTDQVKSLVEQVHRIQNEVLVTTRNDGISEKSDDDYIDAMLKKEMPSYKLEKILTTDLERAIRIRRKYFASLADLNESVNELPYEKLDYSLVTEACCENVLGYVPVPLGYAGPLRVDGRSYFVPMATTEGALIASTNRGCRAIFLSNKGCETLLIRDSMTRAPVVEFDSLKECGKFHEWIEKIDNFRLMKQKFDSTSRYLSLKSVECKLADRYVFLRFSATTGDAMGMNMVSKGTEAVLKMLKEVYFSHTSMRVVSLSGNYCCDKKSAAINWIKGRGKDVVAECVIPARVVSEVLKADVPAMVHLHTAKNLVGSALSGSSGGFNAHAANIVTAVFIACGQDVAQNVSSSQCLTMVTETSEGDLRISCTMPCLEVATVGGGTGLDAQKACLKMLGCAGGNSNCPAANAQQLARIICSAVVAGELSLLAALMTGDLVKSHMKHNRSMVRLPVLKEETLHEHRTSENGPVLAKLVKKAASTSSLAHPESCSKVLT